MERLKIEVIAALTDNYAYLILDESGTQAVVVDPSEAAPVEARLRERGLTLVGVWCTHHHFDHVGGIPELLATRPTIEVLGSAYDLEQPRIPMQTRGLADGDSWTCFGKSVRVLEVPGHTLGAIAYVIDGHVFTGDTLFLGGCGRVFEGTMPMMLASLDKLAALDGSTRVYPGHEYTEKNLEFALSIESDSSTLRQRYEQVRRLRAEGKATAPGTIDEEKATNPFLRVRESSVRARFAASSDASDVFAAVRSAKDNWR